MVGPRERALQRLWKGACDVIVLEQRKDPVTRRQVSEEKRLVSGAPCRLSFELRRKSGTAAPFGHAARLRQECKLFLGRELTVPPGSKLVVTQNGVTTAYKQSGPPAVYAHHQEIRVELFERWA